jgi:hypothetical protein
VFIRTVSFTQITIRLIRFVDTPNSVAVFDNTFRAFKLENVTHCLIRAYLFGSSGDTASSECVCVCVCVCVCRSTRVTTIRRLTCCVWLTVASH